MTLPFGFTLSSMKFSAVPQLSSSHVYCMVLLSTVAFLSLLWLLFILFLVLVFALALVILVTALLAIAVLVPSIAIRIIWAVLPVMFSIMFGKGFSMLPCWDDLSEWSFLLSESSLLFFLSLCSCSQVLLSFSNSLHAKTIFSHVQQALDII